MRKAPRISLALFTSAALLGLAAVPASAAEGETQESISAGSSANIEVQGGEIAISVLPTLESTELKPGEDAEFTVPTVTVTDERAGLIDWNVSVTLTDFATDVIGAKTIQAAGATYSPVQSSLTKSGTAEVVAQEVVLAGDAGKGAADGAVVASGVRGNNTAGWTADLTVPVPADALAGTYSAVLTHSVY